MSPVTIGDLLVVNQIGDIMAASNIVTDIKETIMRECSNPADYEKYTQERLLCDTGSMARFYGITEAQVRLACEWALKEIRKAK